MCRKVMRMGELDKLKKNRWPNLLIFVIVDKHE